MFRPILILLAADLALPAQQVAIRLTNPMNFGTLTVDAAGGMINLTALGVLIPIGPGAQPSGGLGTTPARFLFQGKPRTAFSFALIPQAPVLTGPQGARIILQSFNALPVSQQGVFGADGTMDVQVGGRLDLRQNLPAGAYTANVRLQMTTSGAGGRPVSASQVFQIRAFLQASLKLTCLQGLDFGLVLPGSTAGFLDVQATGGYVSRSPGGPALMPGSAAHPAVFIFQGQAGNHYSIQLPSQVPLAGPRPVAVTGLTLSIPSHGALPPSGKRQFGVGGQVLIQPDQPAGAYKGVLPVTVAYQ